MSFKLTEEQLMIQSMVRDLAREFIQPDRAVIVVAGDARRLKRGLERIAPVHRVDVDGRILD